MFNIFHYDAQFFNQGVSVVTGASSGYEDGPITSAKFKRPNKLVINDKDGSIFVGDESRIRKITKYGMISFICGIIPDILYRYRLYICWERGNRIFRWAL